MSGLRAALESRHVIGIAQGVLAAQYDISYERAFEVLHRYPTTATSSCATWPRRSPTSAASASTTESDSLASWPGFSSSTTPDDGRAGAHGRRVAGAHDDQVDGVEVRVVRPWRRGPTTCSPRTATCSARPPTPGKSGLRHLFDTISRGRGALAEDGSAGAGAGGKRPFGLWAHGRYDTTGAVRRSSIAGALPWGAGRRGAGRSSARSARSRRRRRTSSGGTPAAPPSCREGGGRGSGGGAGLEACAARDDRSGADPRGTPHQRDRVGVVEVGVGRADPDPAPTTQSRSTTDRSMHAPCSTTVPSKSTLSRTTAPLPDDRARPDHAADHGAVHQRTWAEEAVGHLRPRPHPGRRPLAQVVAEDRPVRVTEHAEVVGQRVAVGREVLVRLAQVLQ